MVEVGFVSMTEEAFGTGRELTVSAIAPFFQMKLKNGISLGKYLVLNTSSLKPGTVEYRLVGFSRQNFKTAPRALTSLAYMLCVTLSHGWELFFFFFGVSGTHSIWKFPG